MASESSELLDLFMQQVSIQMKLKPSEAAKAQAPLTLAKPGKVDGLLAA